ncbi:MAG: hypothetical protein J0M12_10565 [Deltaproteobacteria bacterium]|nr:hypothetical protein [Deltaproteobacteria bacterium]
MQPQLDKQQSDLQAALSIVKAAGARAAVPEDFPVALAGQEDGVVGWFTGGPLQYSGFHRFPDFHAVGAASKALLELDPRAGSFRVVTTQTVAMLAIVAEQGGAVLSFSPLRQFQKPGDPTPERPELVVLYSECCPEEVVAIPFETYSFSKLADRFEELTGFELRLKLFQQDIALEAASFADSSPVEQVQSTGMRRGSGAASVAMLVAFAFSFFSVSDQSSTRREQQDLSGLRMPEAFSPDLSSDAQNQIPIFQQSSSSKSSAIKQREWPTADSRHRELLDIPVPNKPK